MRALIAAKTATEPAGITKWGPSLRSMAVAWLMKKVESWAKEMDRAMVDAHTGRTLMKHLNSSTCVTVHSLHWFLVFNASGSVITAALSKKLHAPKKIKTETLTKLSTPYRYISVKTLEHSLINYGPGGSFGM